MGIWEHMKLGSSLKILIEIKREVFMFLLTATPKEREVLPLLSTMEQVCGCPLCWVLSCP
jgi:hypothetical protein